MRRVSRFFTVLFMGVFVVAVFAVAYVLGWWRVRIEIRQGPERPPTVLVFTPTPSGEDIAEATVSALKAEQVSAQATENAVALTQVARATSTPSSTLAGALETTAPLTPEASTVTPTPTPTLTITSTPEIIDVKGCVVEDNSGPLPEGYRQGLVDMLQGILDRFPGVEGTVIGFYDYDHGFQNTECDFLVADYTVPGTLGPAAVSLYRRNHPDSDIYVVGYSFAGSPNWTDQINFDLINTYLPKKRDSEGIGGVFETWLRELTP